MAAQRKLQGLKGCLWKTIYRTTTKEEVDLLGQKRCYFLPKGRFSILLSHLPGRRTAFKLDIVEYNLFRAETFPWGCKICRILERNMETRIWLFFWIGMRKRKEGGTFLLEAKFINSNAHGRRWRWWLAYNTNEAI